MKSNNPIFARSEQFNGTGQRLRQPDTRRRPPAATAQSPPALHRPDAQQVDQGRMTIDSVVQKTAITLAS